jgi:hypothetical protein
MSEKEVQVFSTPVVTSSDDGNVQAVGAEGVHVASGEHLIIGDVIATGQGKDGSTRAVGIQGGTIAPGATVTIGCVQASKYSFSFGSE